MGVYTLRKDKDIILYNEQSKRMTELVGEHQSMKLRVEAYEKAQETLDNEARYTCASTSQCMLLTAH